MANRDFDQGGSPLDDKRLINSGTTQAGQQQYRLWHDGQNIMVPKGQSISKPLQPEVVNANTGVFGDIQQGYFKAPVVEFRNTIDYLLFDRFGLSIYRPELPTDPDIDWPDIGIEKVRVRYNIHFVQADTGYSGRSGGMFEFLYHGRGANGRANYISPVLHFDEYNNQHVRGDFILVTNPTAAQSSIGVEYTTAQFLQPVNLPISAIVNNVRIINGNSEMKVILKNPIFTVTLQSFQFDIIRGEG